MLSLGNHFCSSSIFFLPFFFSALAVALRILILAFNSMSWDSSQPDLGNNPWRPALMTTGQNHRPHAAGLSLCSFRFYPRGFTKMEARKAAGSMTRVTDDWTQLASGFPFLLALFRSDPINKKMSYQIFRHIYEVLNKIYL